MPTKDELEKSLEELQNEVNTLKIQNEDLKGKNWNLTQRVRDLDTFKSDNHRKNMEIKKAKDEIEQLQKRLPKNDEERRMNQEDKKDLERLRIVEKKYKEYFEKLSKSLNAYVDSSQSFHKNILSATEMFGKLEVKLLEDINKGGE